MSAEIKFYAKNAGQAFWLGNKKVKFVKGFYSTSEQQVIDFLRKQKDCSEIVAPVVEEAIVVDESSTKAAKKVVK